MTKTTIELARLNHIAGYGYVTPPWRQDSQQTLDALVAWCALPENEGKKVVRHFVRNEEHPQKVIKYHYASEHGLSDKECAKLFQDRMAKGEVRNSIVHKMGMVNRCIYCDDIYYLDIYWQ